MRTTARFLQITVLSLLAAAAMAGPAAAAPLTLEEGVEENPDYFPTPCWVTGVCDPDDDDDDDDGDSDPLPPWFSDIVVELDPGVFVNPGDGPSDPDPDPDPEPEPEPEPEPASEPEPEPEPEPQPPSNSDGGQSGPASSTGGTGQTAVSAGEPTQPADTDTATPSEQPTEPGADSEPQDDQVDSVDEFELAAAQDAGQRGQLIKVAVSAAALGALVVALGAAFMRHRERWL